MGTVRAVAWSQSAFYALSQLSGRPQLTCEYFDVGPRFHFLTVDGPFWPGGDLERINQIGCSRGPAFSMCIVLRRWTAWWPAAFVGGLLYGFSAYFTVYGSGYLFLVFVPIPPVILLLLHEAMVRQRWRANRCRSPLGRSHRSSILHIGGGLDEHSRNGGNRMRHLSRRNAQRSIRRRRVDIETALSYAIALAALILRIPVLFMLFGTAHISGVPH